MYTWQLRAKVWHSLSGSAHCATRNTHGRAGKQADQPAPCVGSSQPSAGDRGSAARAAESCSTERERAPCAPPGQGSAPLPRAPGLPPPRGRGAVGDPARLLPSVPCPVELRQLPRTLLPGSLPVPGAVTKRLCYRGLSGRARARPAALPRRLGSAASLPPCLPPSVRAGQRRRLPRDRTRR